MVRGVWGVCGHRDCLYIAAGESRVVWDVWAGRCAATQPSPHSTAQ